MALFKSEEERRIERDIKVRQGVRAIEKAIREQDQFAEGFIKNAQAARSTGDDAQYQFIRNALKKTATMKKLLERQLLAVKNALLIKRQAEASATFAASMGTLAGEIGRLFGATDLVKTQVDWEKAMSQSQNLEERMNLFLDTVQDVAADDVASGQEVVSDEEIDRLIDAEATASQQKELDDLAGLRAEVAKLREADKGKQ